MSIITIATPFNIDLEFKVATFPIRVMAWLIDIVVISAYYYVMLRIVYPLLNMDSNISTATSLFILVIPVVLYQLCFEIFLNGQTIGKKITGIKAIDKDGQEPTWGQFIIRWVLCPGNFFIYAVPTMLLQNPIVLIFLLGILYLPDVITILVSRKGQRIGDLAAGIVVIDANYKANINETIYQEIEVQDYTPAFPQVMRLSDRDINGIRNLLDVKRPGKDTEMYMYQVVNKIKKVLNIETDIDGYDFLQQLLHDYNYITSKDSR